MPYFNGLLGLAVCLFSVVTQWQERVRNTECENCLRMIGLDLQNYHDNHGTFPPAYRCDKYGKPVNSWRAEVISNHWYNFRDRYDYSEPWNGPKNAALQLDMKRCQEFQCPSAGNKAPAIANYVAVVGPHTMWPGDKPAKRAADGSDNDKILVIEIVNSDILWMEPRDLTLEEALDVIQPRKGMGVGSKHSEGIHYLTVGGQVRTLDPKIDRESLRKLLTRETAKN